MLLFFVSNQAFERQLHAQALEHLAFAQLQLSAVGLSDLAGDGQAQARAFHAFIKAQAALVFNTSNPPEERENTVFGDPLERIWKDCVFDFCGITSFKRLMFRVVADSTEQERQSWLAQTAETVSRYFPPISANITQGN